MIDYIISQKELIFLVSVFKQTLLFIIELTGVINQKDFMHGVFNRKWT